MATVKVTKSFIDKHTKVVHKVGETFEATKERITEINSVRTDLIQVVKNTADSAVGKKKSKKEVGE